MPKRWASVLLLLLCLTGRANAQAFELALRDCGETALRTRLLVADSAAAQLRLAEWLLQARARGFLAAGYDTLHWRAEGVEACLYWGEPIAWAQLNTAAVPAEYLSKAGFRYRNFDAHVVDPRTLDRLSRRLLREAENDGYPFATIRFDSLTLVDNRLSAQLHYSSGKQISYDSLRLGGDLKLHPKVLARYLQLREGQLYKEEDVQRIARRLNALPYARLRQNAQIYFYNDKASIAVFADNRRVNSFDGMLGLFPNANNDGSLLLTGDLNLLLWSAFRRGELISFNWRSLQAGTQDLKTRVRWPFLFNSPVGLDVDFRLFRRDSSFLEVQSLAGLGYTFSPGNYLKGYLQQRSYRLLGSPQINLSQQARVDGTLYGLEYSLQRLDRAFNPYRGWRMVLGGGAGRRTANAQLQDGAFDGNQTYDQYQLHTEGQVYLPWLRRWQTALQWHGQALFSDNIYANELFRFGGFRTLKGFDEESVFASSYLLLNVEQRFLLDNDSWLYVFWNGGWLRNDAVGQAYRDTPYGVGAGITFQTNSGIFSVAYALGSERNAPLTLRNAKVHLGYRYLL